MPRIFIWWCRNCDWQIECDSRIVDEEDILELISAVLSAHHLSCGAVRDDDEVATRGWGFNIVEYV